MTSPISPQRLAACRPSSTTRAIDPPRPRRERLSRDAASSSSAGPSTRIAWTRRELLALARGARRLFIKIGPDIVRFDRAQKPLTEDQVVTLLVHDDGLMRVPVLVQDDLLVRGYTDELYREALDAREPAEG